MSNDQIKKALISLRRTEHDFSVILSGKKSRKVHGLYKPDSREIIIHNKNFKNDNEMMYTAIHEYAHHIQFTTAATPVSARTHTTAFWNLLHTLLFEAEAKGVYQNPFDAIDEFKELTRQIRDKCLAGSGALMKELGQLLVDAHALCEKHGTSYPDYLDRVLALPRTSAQVIVKAHTLDLDPRVGFENMRTLAAIRDERSRGKAQEELREGHSPDMVKAKYGPTKAPKDPEQALQAERERLVAGIDRMRKRLKEIEKRIAELADAKEG
jgi:predicted ribosome quality control (RQC) complex YloA/Tae2 family protein